jgi:colicin import membrane protein
MVISWPVRHPWAAVVFAVPLTIVGLGGVAAHPSVFLPLLVLAGVALVVMDYFAEQQAQVAGGPPKRNRPSRASQARPSAQRKPSRPVSGAEARARAEAAEAQALAAEAEAQAAEARARAEAAEAQARAKAAETQALAAEARTRATWLRLEAEAKAKEAPQED